MWKTVDIADRWRRFSGVAGQAKPDEIDDVLSGRWDVHTDPALERARHAGGEPGR